MTPRGLLVLVAILAAFLAVFVPIAIRVKSGRDETLDAERLRRTFVALTLYETEHDGLPAPNLGLVRRDVDPTDLQSVADPNVREPEGAVYKNPPKPLDPALPNLGLFSPTRVSWSYRWHWPNAGDPATAKLDPRRGLLAGWWTGPVLRIGMDGALVRKPHIDALTFEGLFGG